jgi:hypothetical protein
MGIEKACIPQGLLNSLLTSEGSIASLTLEGDYFTVTGYNAHPSMIAVTYS